MVGLVLLDLPGGVDRLRADYLAIWGPGRPDQRSWWGHGVDQVLHQGLLWIRLRFPWGGGRCSGGLRRLLRLHVCPLHQDAELPEQVTMARVSHKFCHWPPCSSTVSPVRRKCKYSSCLNLYHVGAVLQRLRAKKTAKLAAVILIMEARAYILSLNDIY